MTNITYPGLIFITSITNSSIAKGIRTCIATLFNPKDSRSGSEVSPYGVDGCPVAGMQAVFVQTSKKSQPVFIGYVNKLQKAAPGEFRIYATDASGVEQVKVWLHADGTLEIGGTSGSVNANHAVQWEALNSKLTNYFTSLNAAINTSITGLSGAYTPPTAIDLSSAKEVGILVP